MAGILQFWASSMSTLHIAVSREGSSQGQQPMMTDKVEHQRNCKQAGAGVRVGQQTPVRKDERQG
eukprot:1159584-Pelagomonas_calceolata.AAC.13